MRKALKNICYFLEYLLLSAAILLLKIIGMRKAANLMANLTRFVGPYTKSHRTAQKNLKLIYPKKSDEEIAMICDKMWDNLGRSAAEMLFISKMTDDEFKKRVSFKNIPNKIPHNCVLVSAHFGNFEVAVKAAAFLGLKINLIYREANNPFVEKLIVNLRSHKHITLHKKKRFGMRSIFKVAQEGKEAIGMLVDQKTNNGMEIEFMGKVAKTTNLPAKLAKRFNMPLIVFVIKRLDDCRFEFVFSDELKLDKDTSDVEIMTKINQIIESEIDKEPHQWFWVHNRWK